MSGIDFDAFNKEVGDLQPSPPHNNTTNKEPPTPIEEELDTTGGNADKDENEQVTDESVQVTDSNTSDNLEDQTSTKDDKNNFITPDSLKHVVICIVIILFFSMYLLPKYLANRTTRVDGVDVTESKFDLKSNSLDEIYQTRLSDLGQTCINFETPNGYCVYYFNDSKCDTVHVEYYERIMSMYKVIEFTMTNQGSFDSNKEKIQQILNDFRGSVLDNLTK